MLRDPKKVTLLDIINVIDGDDFFRNCVIHNHTCSYVDSENLPCPLHDDYGKIRENLIDLFRKKTVYELAEKAGNTELMII